MDLKTKYMGVELKNPVIIGASNLVTDLRSLKKIEEEGAAAVVYKTLFEEQIHLENLQDHHAEEDYANRHAEMSGSPYPSFEEAGPEAFLTRLKEQFGNAGGGIFKLTFFDPRSFSDLFFLFLSCLSANFGIHSSSKTFGQILPHSDFRMSFSFFKILHVSVNSN